MIRRKRALLALALALALGAAVAEAVEQAGAGPAIEGQRVAGSNARRTFGRESS